MLIAEIHGLYVPEARNSEDYLTSAVFGHLRYVKPGPFWEALFDLAISQPIGSDRMTAGELIRLETGCPLSSFTSLEAIFWPEHKQGIPDLVLHFSGNQTRSVVVLVEAKLDAGKSGHGEYDQLARYLRILDSLGELRPPLPSDAIALSVYLTAIDSRSDVIESLAEFGDTPESRKRLYQLQWQDLVRAIGSTQPSSETEALILRDVRAFLHTRGLEYFSGMDAATDLPTVLAVNGDFLIEEPLFDLGCVPTYIDGIEERWMHVD
jgi:hypothetical protein